MPPTTPFTTPQAVESLRPNVHEFPPEDIIPEALIFAATTHVADVRGDEPVVKCPYIEVEEPGFVPEGDEIPVNPIDSREGVIATGALATLTVVSVDQYRHNGVSALLTSELKRSMILKADTALLSQPAPAGKKITPPPGLLVQDHASGGEIVDNLDALSDAIAQIEAEGGTADVIVTSPLGWSAVSKLKTAVDSNQSLLGPPGVAAARVLLSVPVRVAARVPEDTLLVIDKRAVLSAFSPLEVATSEHASFRRRSIETRLWWRIGATITHPDRVIELTVAAVEEEVET